MEEDGVRPTTKRRVWELGCKGRVPPQAPGPSRRTSWTERKETGPGLGVCVLFGLERVDRS